MCVCVCVYGKDASMRPAEIHLFLFNGDAVRKRNKNRDAQRNKEAHSPLLYLHGRDAVSVWAVPFGFRPGKPHPDVPPVSRFPFFKHCAPEKDQIARKISPIRKSISLSKWRIGTLAIFFHFVRRCQFYPPHLLT